MTILDFEDISKNIIIGDNSLNIIFNEIYNDIEHIGFTLSSTSISNKTSNSYVLNNFIYNSSVTGLISPGNVISSDFGIFWNENNDVVPPVQAVISNYVNISFYSRRPNGSGILKIKNFHDDTINIEKEIVLHHDVSLNQLDLTSNAVFSENNKWYRGYYLQYYDGNKYFIDDFYLFRNDSENEMNIEESGYIYYNLFSDYINNTSVIPSLNLQTESFFCSNNQYITFDYSNNQYKRLLSKCFKGYKEIDTGIQNNITYTYLDLYTFPIDSRVKIGKKAQTEDLTTETLMPSCALLDENYDVVITHIGFFFDFRNTVNDTLDEKKQLHYLTVMKYNIMVHYEETYYLKYFKKFQVDIFHMIPVCIIYIHQLLNQRQNQNQRLYLVMNEE